MHVGLKSTMRAYLNYVNIGLGLSLTTPTLDSLILRMINYILMLEDLYNLQGTIYLLLKAYQLTRILCGSSKSDSKVNFHVNDFLNTRTVNIKHLDVDNGSKYNHDNHVNSTKSFEIGKQCDLKLSNTKKKVSVHKNGNRNVVLRNNGNNNYSVTSGNHECKQSACGKCTRKIIVKQNYVTCKNCTLDFHLECIDYDVHATFWCDSCFHRVCHYELPFCNEPYILILVVSYQKVLDRA